MEFLFIIAIIILIALIMPKSGKASSATASTEKLIVKAKQCPPHQWYWQERIDENGIDQGARIVCKMCGPISAQSGREE